MITVIIADDHAIVRSGLCRMLNAEPDIDVVAEAANGREAVKLCLEHKPDVLVLDYNMPEMDGFKVVQLLHDSKTATKILVLTMYDREDFAMRFVKAGAAGFLPKQNSYEELLFAIRKIMAGAKYIAPSADDQNASQSSADDDTSNALSDREHEIMLLLARGSSLKEIALALSISYSTVKTHRNRLMKKRGFKNVSDITRYAVSTGLIDNI